MPTYRLYASMGTEVSVLRAHSLHAPNTLPEVSLMSPVYDLEPVGRAIDLVTTGTDNHSDYKILPASQYQRPI